MKTQYTTVILFVVYLVILMKLVVFKHPLHFTDLTTITSLFSLNSNFIPLKTIVGYLTVEPSWQIAIKNLAGNVLLFLPFGAFLPLIFRTMTWKAVLLVAVIVSITFEAMQVFVIGTPDIDDVILNTFGAWLGYVAFIWTVSMVKRAYAKHS